uniref:Uncharacterized protein n=1 Tax=virus sp. ctah610 TaxID=2826807 RepID=A0A8S5R7L7_9VIRU|nr:MAG TPA: hypothetical protein [virus sp. ctah610]
MIYRNCQKKDVRTNNCSSVQIFALFKWGVIFLGENFPGI